MLDLVADLVAGAWADGGRGAGLQDAAQQIAALRAAGAQQLDPARFCFIEALARRASAYSGEVRQALDAKLAAALLAYSARQAAAQADPSQHSPQFKARQTLPQAPSPLAELVLRLDRQTLATAAGPLVHPHAATAGAAAGPAELKALRHFRSTWAKLSVDRQLRQSKAKMPDNAGPLNSQLLVLRALQCMQATAPAYLSRLMSSVDSLLWLDQAGVGGATAPGNSGRSERDKQRKAGRSKTA